MALRRCGSSKQRLLILATIARSGTHYMRYLIANYLQLTHHVSRGPLSPIEVNTMFPNQWTAVYDSRYAARRPPTPMLRPWGVDDLPLTHGPYKAFLWRQSRVLHLYRNPLDFAVSLWFWIFKGSRPTRPGVGRDGSADVSGPVELLQYRLDDYISWYLSYREAAARESSLLRIAYEDLVTYPEACLRTVVAWLGAEPVPWAVRKSVEYSSRETVGKMEKQLPFNVAVDLTKVRDGRIGQWRTYFSSSDVDRVQEAMRLRGIDLTEFILEPAELVVS
jgi:hypothetical protein